MRYPPFRDKDVEAQLSIPAADFAVLFLREIWAGRRASIFFCASFQKAPFK